LKRTRHAVLALYGASLLAACAGAEPERQQVLGSDEIPMHMWSLTTSSEEARRHVAEGQYLVDVGRFGPEAYERFRLAVEADPDFALGYLLAALVAPSLAEQRASLSRAEALAEGASDAERVLIRIVRAALDEDQEAALALARELAEREADNPRAWLVLATIESSMSREEAARASMAKALTIDPDFVAGHVMLANSYIFVRPLDFARADEHVRRAIALVPNEPFPYDLLGDLYRSRGRLEEAAEAYTRAAERDPDNAALAYQQRGHVHSFLRDFERARADYDAAIRLARGNEKAAFGVWRALVNVHAGDLRAAIEELEQLYQAIAGMGVPDPDAIKLLLLQYEGLIALHHGELDVAERAVERATALLRKRADQVGTDGFRRAREAEIAYWEGLLAARKGDYARATGRARSILELVASSPNPASTVPAHEVLGLVALLQGQYEGAVGHYARAVDLQLSLPQYGANAYLSYHYGLALEGAGRTAEAKEMFRRAAGNYFNDAGAALVHDAAVAKIAP
jgi:tetratricopeptide (TPR) repeat protein